MRDYGIVAPRFWIGETGKKLRGDPVAQLVALYLMTSPHATMTGVFHCPILYISHETGTPSQGASKALQRLIKGGFCEYDTENDTVFVIRMAAYQIAESLKPSDNRIHGLKKDVDKMPSALLRQRFLQVYGRAFHLVSEDWKPSLIRSPSEAPSEALRSQDQDQDQDQEQKQKQEQEGRGETEKTVRASRSPRPGTRIPDDFSLTDDQRAYARDRGVDPDSTFEAFVAYWRSKPKDNTKLDWNLTWITWVLKEAKDVKQRSAPRMSRYDLLVQGKS